jgi:hypothetical protein
MVLCPFVFVHFAEYSFSMLLFQAVRTDYKINPDTTSWVKVPFRGFRGKMQATNKTV